MRELKACSHCGSAAAERANGDQVYVQCSNTEGRTMDDDTWVPPCGMCTPQYGPSLEYGAKDRVTSIWNASINGGPGTKENPLAVPQAIYYPEKYYMEGEVLYLCYKEYDSKGGHRPSQLIWHYFAPIEED